MICNLSMKTQMKMAERINDCTEIGFPSYFCHLIALCVFLLRIATLSSHPLVLLRFNPNQSSRYHSQLHQIGTKYFIWCVNEKSHKLNCELLNLCVSQYIRDTYPRFWTIHIALHVQSQHTKQYFSFDKCLHILTYAHSKVFL